MRESSPEPTELATRRYGRILAATQAVRGLKGTARPYARRGGEPFLMEWNLAR
jgi:hypothetical protein